MVEGLGEAARAPEGARPGGGVTAREAQDRGEVGRSGPRVGSDASKCYCETTDSCQVTGNNCGKAKSPAAAAEVFGNSEGNCATPKTLFESAIQFMARQAPDARLVYFTGDFAEAGASYACHGSERVGNESRGQINGQTPFRPI